MHASCFRLKHLAVGGLLLCAALSSAALTLGRARGNVWLGQGVDVSIQVQYEANESLSNLCFEAEVFHADTRQDPGQVRVAVEAGTQAQTALVRVRSTVPVDEPVVTVYLRETCATKSTRRYVLLAEVPAEGVNSNALTVLPTVTPAPASKPVAAPPAAVPVAAVSAGATVAVKRRSDNTAAVRTQAIGGAPAKEKAAPVRDAAAAPVAKSSPPRPAEAPAKPRLKIDPVESLSERVASLEAGAQTPRPTQISPDDPRLKKLEDSVQALLTLAAKNERGMADLRERLQQAEAAKYDNPLVYGLGALLLAALGGVAYLWRRQQQVRPEAALWPENGQDEPEAPQARGVLDASAAMSAATAARYAPATSVAPVYAPVFEPEPQSDAQPSMATEAQDSTEAAPLTDSPEVDLDDLIAPNAGAASLYAPSTEPAQAAEFPSLAESGSEGEPQSAGPAAELEPEAPPLAQFPMAGEVTIDVSHLSLTPVGEPAKPVQAAPAPLLDFDFDLIPPATPPQEPEAGAPPPAPGTQT